MKFINILATAIALSTGNFVVAQTNVNTSNEENFASTTTYSKDTLSGMDNSIVNSRPVGYSYGTCTLIKNNYSDRKIKHYKNGYKITMADKSEMVKVKKGKNGARKIRYIGETEDLKYHKTSDGKIHYKYTYDEDCRHILVKKNKKGITTTNHKSSLSWEEIESKVTEAINSGVSTCSVTD